MDTALIFGVTGQCGSYLSELLLEKGYKVVGVSRRVSIPNTGRIEHLLGDENFVLVEGDVTDSWSVSDLISTYKPMAIYNLAAQSHVKTSFDQPSYTFDVVAKGPLNIFEAVRRYSPESRVLTCSSSEMFGDSYEETDIEVNSEQIKWTKHKYQNENTRFSPQSPYAVAKLAAHNLVRIYREAYKLHISAILMFNNESSRRGENFVTRKITKYVAYVNSKTYYLRQLGSHQETVCKQDPIEKLKLGNIKAKRDWGHSRDFCLAMYLMLQQEKPDDFVIATGETHSVEEFLEKAFQCINIDNWQDYIEIDPNLYRPAEVDYLLGDASKAKRILGWSPQTTFDELVKEMVEHDISQLQ